MSFRYFLPSAVGLTQPLHHTIISDAGGRALNWSWVVSHRCLQHFKWVWCHKRFSVSPRTDFSRTSRSGSRVTWSPAESNTYMACRAPCLSRTNADNVKTRDASKHEVCHFCVLKVLNAKKHSRISQRSRIREDFRLSAAHLAAFELLFKEKMTTESTHDLQLVTSVCWWSILKT